MLTIHKVRKVLGDDVANALYENFPGEQLNIPKKKSSMEFETNEARNQCIYNLYYNAKKSYDEIGDIMDLHKDTIRKIISENYENKTK